MKSTMSHWYDNDGSFLDKAERRGFLWLDIPFNFIKYSLIQSYMFRNTIVPLFYLVYL